MKQFKIHDRVIVRIGLIVLWLLLAINVLLGILNGWTQVVIFSTIIVVIVLVQTHLVAWEVQLNNIASVKEHEQYLAEVQHYMQANSAEVEKFVRDINKDIAQYQKRIMEKS